MSRVLGLYDSGLGGVCVFDYLLKKDNTLNLVLYADSIHAPYGDKKITELEKYSNEVMSFFKEQNITDVLIACNTISATVLDTLKSNHPDMNIMGIIDITCDEVKNNNLTDITVVATSNTINSNAYQQQFDSKIQAYALPKLASMIEQQTNKKDIQIYINHILKEPINNLILGCTHYPLVKNLFESKVRGKIFDSNESIYQIIKDKGYQSDTSIQKIYTSGNVDEFKQQINNLLQVTYEVSEV